MNLYVFKYEVDERITRTVVVLAENELQAAQLASGTNATYASLIGEPFTFAGSEMSEHPGTYPQTVLIDHPDGANVLTVGGRDE